ncbi:hypothetical protein CSPAE12_04626 [Colletotrichum incanum]|nr:hypothetical protein CSPAE12_04626 [Colletotrichum incanum]
MAYQTAHHNTLFAQWWKCQPLPEGDESPIHKAILARGIMNNNLSYILSPNGACIRLIWYPAIVASSTFEALARLIPSVRLDVARAAIFSNNQTLPIALLSGMTCKIGTTHTFSWRGVALAAPGIGANRDEPDSIYNDMSCNASYVETYISIPEEWRRAPQGYKPENGITP